MENTLHFATMQMEAVLYPWFFGGYFMITIGCMCVLIHTLFKGGNASEFDNYMGITIGSIIVKLFAMILNKRLSK